MSTLEFLAPLQVVALSSSSLPQAGRKGDGGEEGEEGEGPKKRKRSDKETEKEKEDEKEDEKDGKNAREEKEKADDLLRELGKLAEDLEQLFGRDYPMDKPVDHGFIEKVLAKGIWIYVWESRKRKGEGEDDNKTIFFHRLSIWLKYGNASEDQIMKWLDWCLEHFEVAQKELMSRSGLPKSFALDLKGEQEFPRVTLWQGTVTEFANMAKSYVCLLGHHQILRRLLKAGVSVDYKDLDQAIYSFSSPLVELLLVEQLLDLRLCDRSYIRKTSDSVLQVLIQSGLDVNAPAERMMLHDAVRDLDVDRINLLLKAGAETNFLDERGRRVSDQIFHATPCSLKTDLLLTDSTLTGWMSVLGRGKEFVLERRKEIQKLEAQFNSFSFSPSIKLPSLPVTSVIPQTFEVSTELLMHDTKQVSVTPCDKAHTSLFPVCTTSADSKLETLEKLEKLDLSSVSSDEVHSAVEKATSSALFSPYHLPNWCRPMLLFQPKGAPTNGGKRGTEREKKTRREKVMEDSGSKSGSGMVLDIEEMDCLLMRSLGPGTMQPYDFERCSFNYCPPNGGLLKVSSVKEEGKEVTEFRYQANRSCVWWKHSLLFSSIVQLMHWDFCQGKGYRVLILPGSYDGIYLVSNLHREWIRWQILDAQKKLVHIYSMVHSEAKSRNNKLSLQLTTSHGLLDFTFGPAFKYEKLYPFAFHKDKCVPLADSLSGER